MLAAAAVSPGQQLLLKQMTVEGAPATRRRQAMEASMQTDHHRTSGVPVDIDLWASNAAEIGSSLDPD